MMLISHSGRIYLTLVLGLNITTLEQAEPIPTNLRLGTAFRYHLDSDNSVTFVFDVNKLMVPSPPIIVIDPKSGERSLMKGKETDRSLFSSTFGSFTDAPEGFSEEMKGTHLFARPRILV